MQHGGMEIEALKNRPSLNQWVHEYWEAFHILSGSRMTHQGGIGPVPFSELVAYMQCIGMQDVDDRLKFIKMIQGLDNVYVLYVNEKAQQRVNRDRAQAKRTPRKR
jgi:hypothetical protein